MVGYWERFPLLARKGVLGMSRESTPRHAQTAGDCFAMQINAKTSHITPFIPRERPNVKHAIAGYLRPPQPTSAPALMRVLHWLRC